jgi:hypothetical protein
MGFMGLSVVESDEASDAFHQANKAIARSLKAELRNKGNSHNTPGFFNVAMIFDEFIIPGWCKVEAVPSDPLVKVAKETVSMLDKFAKELEKSQQDIADIMDGSIDWHREAQRRSARIKAWLKEYNPNE